MSPTKAPTPITSTSPHDRADVVGSVMVDDTAAITRRVEQARARAITWAATPAAARSRMIHDAAGQLEAHSAQLVDLCVREVGKPVSEAVGELQRAIGILRYYAQLALMPTGEILPSDTAGGRLAVQRHPHGVIGLITPWNFPVAIPVWKAAPALAAGNAVVVKASPLSAVTTQRAAEIIAGCLPPDTLQVVHGWADTGRALVDAADAVSFTGSNAVGARVISACAARGVPVQAEMGGSNAAIVLDDAPETVVREQLTYAIAGYAGQKCTATRRVIVVGDSTPVTEILRDALAALRVGDPAEGATVIGPLITEAAATAVVEAVDSSTAAGVGRALWAGGRPEPQPGYVTPCLVIDASADSLMRTAEIFGPVAAVVGVPDVDTAVRIANEVPFGLTASVHSGDTAHAETVASRLHVGMVKINEPTTGVSFQAPFGGEGMSSFGPREQGRTAMDMFTWQQTVSVGPAPVRAGG